VVSQDVGTRIDSFLASHLTDVSRTRLQRAIEDGDVLVNSRQVKPSYRLRADDHIEIDLPEPPPLSLEPEAIPLNIVYEDGDLIVLDKPAGMVVHPGAGISSGTLANGLAYHFARLSGTGGYIRPGIVHRLDKETSGLLVAAKNDLTHERLSEQFQRRVVRKLYIALVYGRVRRDTGEINARIGRSPRNRTRMAVLSGSAGREAITLFKTTARYDEFTRLEAQPKTGRTHQIRVHLSHIGHPVVGDSTYGSGRLNEVKNRRVRQAIAALGRHFLHAAELAFDHPRTGEKLQFKSPLPEEPAAIISLIE
jgi:23S rRNA pseudouridine1911/1915/1917 synthase